MSELNITAGQLTGVVYAKFEPPLCDEQLQLIKDSDVLQGAENGETKYDNRIIRFRPDWSDFSEFLVLEAKDTILKMGELLASQGVTVIAEEALLNGQNWYFDMAVGTASITREATDNEIQRKKSNERAAQAFSGMLGGWGAVFANDAQIVAARIADSDIDDQLSGLRHVADDMEFQVGPRNVVKPYLGTVSPEAARHWLLKQKRAEELPTGELRIIGDNTDHYTLTGIWIAQQDETVLFVNAYRAMSPASPLTDDTISETGASITASYLEDQIELTGHVPRRWE